METLGNKFYGEKNTFFCNYCNTDCRYKSDWERHVMTRKHKSQSQMETKFGENYGTPLKKETIICSVCNMQFKSRSGHWKHFQKCKENKNEEVYDINNKLHLDKEMFLMIVKQNQELMDLLKLGTNNYNSNNVNSNNKTFNLQVFLNETCKNAMNIDEFIESINPSLADLENVGRVGYVEGISKIIINKLNTMEVTERPIHCSDLKREILYIKNDNVWNKETEDKPILLKAIKEVANKNMKNILEWQKANPGCTKSDSLKNDLYLKIVSNSMCGSTKEETTRNFNKILSRVTKKVTISDCKT
jgi:Zinc-finger of C2H2 type